MAKHQNGRELGEGRALPPLGGSGPMTLFVILTQENKMPDYYFPTLAD